MKAVCFIAIMLFVLFTVGSASAEPITLTEDNSNIQVNDHIMLPDGLFQISVNYNPSTGQIVYQYTGNIAPGNGPYITNPKIFEVGYNLDRDGIVSPGTWTNDNNIQFDGFGSLLRDYRVDKQNSVILKPITVQLDKAADGSATYPSFPTQGNAVALHLAFDNAYYANGTAISIPNEISIGDGSSYFAGGVQVPEFSSMALPVAAILGLLFITQRRKEN